MSQLFFGPPVQIARYDRPTYPIFEKLTEKQLGFFWRPQEVDTQRERADFRKLTDAGQHIFTSNIKRQIVLDTKQGAAPSVAFLPIVSLPEAETWISTWTFSETIHSRSYTHIVREVYSDPSSVLDTVMDIEPILQLQQEISASYDKLILLNARETAGLPVDPYEHREALWLCLNAVNILEGVRFYVSFACSWAFAENKTMEGNAKIIKLICRDENLHLASTQHMLKILPKEDKLWQEIADKNVDRVINMYDEGLKSEMNWAEYLFSKGSILGLNGEMLCDFARHRTAKVCSAAGYRHLKVGTNPLPWTERWISGAEVQVAPQETEISSYIVGGLKNDVTADSFKGMSL